MRISDYSLSYKWIIAWFAIFSILGGLLIGLDYIVKDSTKIWNGQCNFVSWRKSNFSPTIRMIVTYDQGKLAEVQNLNVIASYLLNPGVLTDCNIYKSGNARCKPRPPKIEKTASN